ncbi:hypothetical protein [Streptomyces amritsarensis]
MLGPRLQGQHQPPTGAFTDRTAATMRAGRSRVWLRIGEGGMR